MSVGGGLWQVSIRACVCLCARACARVFVCVRAPAHVCVCVRACVRARARASERAPVRAPERPHVSLRLYVRFQSEFHFPSLTARTAGAALVSC